MDDGEMKEKKDDGEMEKDDGEMKEEKIKCKVLLLSRLEKKKKKNDINKNNRMIYQN